MTEPTNAAAGYRKRQKKGGDLTEQVRSGESGAYEALQLFRARASRCIPGDVEKAVALCLEGGRLLLTEGYGNAGQELAMLAVGFLKEHRKPYTEESKAWIFELEPLYGKDDAALQNKKDWLKECIEWSSQQGERHYGDAALHSRLAEAYWGKNTSKDQEKAYKHFALGEAPQQAVGHIVAKYPQTSSTVAQQRERDMLVLKQVLYFLSYENLRDANGVITAFEAAVSSHRSGTLTFSKQLLKVCERDAAQLFQQLCSSNRQLVMSDQVYQRLLMEIGNKFFGIAPPANPMTMIRSMLGI